MSRSRQKGTRFESEVCEYLAAHGHPYAERRAMRGAKDCGDIAGIPGWVLECKATREIDLAGAVDEAAKEAANLVGLMDWPNSAAIIKRRMKSTAASYVVMTLEQFARLLSEEGS